MNPAEVVDQLRDGVARAHRPAHPDRRADARRVASDVVGQGSHEGQLAPADVAERSSEGRPRDRHLHHETGPPGQPARADGARARGRRDGLQKPVVSAVAQDLEGHACLADAEPGADDSRAWPHAGNSNASLGGKVDDEVRVEGVFVRADGGVEGTACAGGRAPRHGSRGTASKASRRLKGAVDGVKGSS